MTNYPTVLVNPNELDQSELVQEKRLQSLGTPLFVVDNQNQLALCEQIQPTQDDGILLPLVGIIPACRAESLGDAGFKNHHQVRYCYHAGAMANGIASAEMVIALGKVGILASFGAAGLTADEISKALDQIQTALPQGPYAVNLIHSPKEPLLEKRAVETFIQMGVTTVEASAYLDLTEHIVYYRCKGLSQHSDGTINIAHKVIAKVSRTEVARRFMSPAPKKMLDKLISQGLISTEQASLALQVPMADDITAEADSGGHTDNRPFLTLLPTILNLRNELQQQYQFNNVIRVGAGGGIGTPEAALAAFTMGAAYIVLGSVHQSCVEAGASEHTRKLLAQAEMADVTMAPAADMFEMGVKLQVLKRGSMFAMRAQKLYDLYVNYDSIESIPNDEREKIEAQIFRASLNDIWQITQNFFSARDPEMLQKAKSHPKRKMALIFRWYLGLSSRWSNQGEKGREMDYQIWAGPSLGAFNQWAKNKPFNEYQNRKVAEIALSLLNETAVLNRRQSLFNTRNSD